MYAPSGVAAPVGAPPEALTPEGWLRILPSFWPERGGLDGFFAARLERIAYNALPAQTTKVLRLRESTFEEGRSTLEAIAEALRQGRQALVLLPEIAAAYLLTFARVGTLIMLMPGLGEQLVSARLRLAFALLVSLVLFPMVRPLLPVSGAGPGSPALVALLFGETLIGLMLGLDLIAIGAALGAMAWRLRGQAVPEA